MVIPGLSISIPSTPGRTATLGVHHREMTAGPAPDVDEFALLSPSWRSEARVSLTEDLASNEGP